MIETNFQKLMAGANDLLAEITGIPVANSHSVPNIIYKCVMVLAPAGYEWQDIIVNLYDATKPDRGYPEGFSIVLHGHGRGTQCFAIYLCHVHGYSPVGSEHPGFLKRYKEMWNE